MNKAQFLRYLATLYHTVGTVSEAVPPADFACRKNNEGFSFYVVGVYDECSGCIKRGNVFFQVQNEGDDDEVVFWEERERPEFITRPVDTEFADAVNAKIAERKNSIPGYLAHEIVEINPAAQFAIIRVLRRVSDVARDERYVLAGSPLTITPMQ